MTTLTYLKAIILGLVQGLAEFLPISSSGHLTLLQYFFGIEGDSVLIFTVLLHLGTLVAVFLCYWQDIWELIKELFAMFKDVFTGKGFRLNANPTRRLGVMIIVATIPTAIIGLLFEDIFESFYRGTNTGKQEGSGLGLYICRRLMHLMDGEIFADIVDDNVMCVTLEL